MRNRFLDVVLSPSRLVGFVSCGGLLLWFGHDGTSTSAPFLSFTSSPCPSDSLFSMRRSRYRGSARSTAICVFSSWLWTRDDFVDCSGLSGTWLSRNSRCIQNQFHHSCGPGHARLRHFLLDAGKCRVGTFFLTFLMPHTPIMISRWKPCSPLSHSCEICGRFPSVVLTAISATAFRNNRLPWWLS